MRANTENSTNKGGKRIVLALKLNDNSWNYAQLGFL